jgi:hypothetical protein
VDLDLEKIDLDRNGHFVFFCVAYWTVLYFNWILLYEVWIEFVTICLVATVSDPATAERYNIKTELSAGLSDPSATDVTQIWNGRWIGIRWRDAVKEAISLKVAPSKGRLKQSQHTSRTQGS